MDAAGRPWRLFIALPLPEEAAGAVFGRLAPVRARFPTARWLGPDSFHLTLLFLGSTEPERLPEVQTAIDAAAADVNAFEIELGTGAGRERRGDDGVAWLRLAHGGTETQWLAERVADVVGRLRVGDRRGPRYTPSAHLTVARHAPDELIRDPEFGQGIAPPVRWQADAIVLFRSHLQPRGAAYSHLHDTRLENPGRA